MLEMLLEKGGDVACNVFLVGAGEFAPWRIPSTPLLVQRSHCTGEAPAAMVTFVKQCHSFIECSENAST